MCLSGVGKVIREAAGAGDEGDVLQTGPGLGLTEASARAAAAGGIGFSVLFPLHDMSPPFKEFVADRL